jgi:hypothetical protein
MPYEKSEISLPEGFVSLGENLSKKMDEAMSSFSNKDGEDKVYYPSLYFENVKELKDMPTEGIAMIRYKKVMEKTESVKTEDGTDKRYSVELCICGIKPQEDLSEESEMEEDDEDAIESGLADAETGMEDEEESEEEEEY